MEELYLFELIRRYRSELTCVPGEIGMISVWLEKEIKKNPENINTVNSKGQTPLMVAIELANDDAIEILLKHPKITVNNQDQYGRTALHYLVKKMNDINSSNLLYPLYEKSLATLLSKRIIASITDILGHTALYYADPQLKTYAQNLIWQQADKLLLEGARRGDWRAVQLAMRDGANIDVQDPRLDVRGNTAAHYAIKYVINQICQDPQCAQAALNFVRLILSYQPSLAINNHLCFMPFCDHSNKAQLGQTAVQLAATWHHVLKVLLETQKERMKYLLADHRYRQ